MPLMIKSDRIDFEFKNRKFRRNEDTNRFEMLLIWFLHIFFLLNILYGIIGENQL